MLRGGAESSSSARSVPSSASTAGRTSFSAGGSQTDIHKRVYQREAVLQVPSIAVFHLDLGGYPYGVCQRCCSETHQRS